MRTELINKFIAAQLVPTADLDALSNGRVTELLLKTGAKLVLTRAGSARRYAIFGYAADGSDLNLKAILA